MKSIPRGTYLSVILVLFIFQCTTITFSSNYYVDKNASGNNNGTSGLMLGRAFRILIGVQ